MTCIQSVCAQAKDEHDLSFSACGLLESGEVDGIALATHMELDLANAISTATRAYGIYFSRETENKADHVLWHDVNVDTAGDPANNNCFGYTKSGAAKKQVFSVNICKSTYSGTKPTCYECTSACQPSEAIATKYATEATSGACPAPFKPDYVSIVSRNGELRTDN